jgi:hypothetical protein
MLTTKAVNGSQSAGTSRRAITSLRDTLIKPCMLREADMRKSSRESTLPIALFAGLHLLCCGIPLLLLSGVSLAFLVPDWPVAGGVVAVIGVIGFIWYLKRGCATCPRNEGRCAHGEACAPARTGQTERDE